MTTKFSIVIILIFSICSGCCANNYYDLSGKTTDVYAKEVKKKYGLELIGKGDGTDDNIQYLILHFISRRKVDISQARVLYISTFEGLLNKINKDEKIQPYLPNHPFTYKNVKMLMGFVDPNGNEYKDKAIALVTIVKGNLVYAIEWGGILKECHEESYEDAFKIVHDSQQIEKVDLGIGV